MNIQLDTDTKTFIVKNEDGERRLPLYSREAFEALSDAWVKVGWGMRYSYTFTWMGRPIIQLPEDVIRMQEVIWRLKPDFIIETGVAHGGSLVFYASLLNCIGKGRVIGIDIEIRPHNRREIENHPLFGYIDLVEGSSIDPAVLADVESRVGLGATVLVILDSNHSRSHVLAELNAYHHFVSPGSYIVAEDGVMSEVYDAPGGKPGWVTDNPTQAAIDFVATHPEFVLEQPAWPFNESTLDRNVTCWPGAWLRRS